MLGAMPLDRHSTVERAVDRRGGGETTTRAVGRLGDDSHSFSEPRIEAVAGKEYGASGTE